MTPGFAYFRKAGDRYHPATPRAALKALEGGLVPAESFIFLGTSVRPLDEEPVTLEEMERILSRENLDLNTNLLLMRVFRRLLASSDPEITLFAAEGINRIESRFAHRIETLKHGWVELREPRALKGLSLAYYQLAQIHPASIRNFYLHEAFGCIKELMRRKLLQRRDVGLLVRILLDLRLPGQALSVLKRLSPGDDPAFVLLEAEVEFQLRNFPRVRELCLRLERHGDSLSQAARRSVELWTGA